MFGKIISTAGGGSSITASGTSGIYQINEQIGPNITIYGDASVQVSQPTANNILISTSGFVSGIYQQLYDYIGYRIQKYIGYFKNENSISFTHGLNTKHFTYNVYTSGLIIEPIQEESLIISDENNVQLNFNSNEVGYIVIIG